MPVWRNNCARGSRISCLVSWPFFWRLHCSHYFLDTSLAKTKCDCIRYFSVSLGGGWIRCRAMQGRCYGFLGWRWTWTENQWGNVSFSRNAFVVLWFVVIFQVVEQDSCVAMRRRHNSKALCAYDLFLVNITCLKSKKLPDNGWWSFSRD